MLSVSVASQECSELEKLKAKTYDFRPSKASDAQRKAKGGQMDAFWNAAKGKRDCVAALLKKEGDGNFFLFDGAALLMQEDQRAASAEIARDAVLRADLADVDVAGYLDLYLRIHRAGADVGPLAVKLMNEPTVSGFVPQHSLQIDRNVAAMFLFGPLSADQNDRYLVPLFGHANKETRESAIYMGTAALTPAALKALKALDRKTVSKELTSVIDSVLFRHQVKLDAKPKYTREQILAKLRKFPEMDESDYSENESKEIDKSIILTLNKDDVPALRDARARSFTSVSDESLYRYRDLTNLLLTLVNRLDLYSEDRIAPVAK